MGHPSEGELRAFLDGEMAGEERSFLRAHLQSCGPCRSMAEAQEKTSRQVARALSLLDQEPALDVGEARLRVHARTTGGAGSRVYEGGGSSTDSVGPGRARSNRRARIRLPFLRSEHGVPLPWAASIALLVTAGAASALPGSPVREWVAQGWGALTGSGDAAVGLESVEPAAEEAPTAPATADPAETGASILAGEEGVELWILGLPAGADLRVVRVDGNMAGIFAGEGTRFRTEEGRLEAEAPPGAVRVEIPRSLENAVVGVNGTVLLRLAGGKMEIFGPVQRRTPMEILFRPDSP